MKRVLFLWLLPLFAESPELRRDPKPMTLSVIIPCAAFHFQHLPYLLECYAHQTCVPDEVVISLSDTRLLQSEELERFTQREWPFRLVLLQAREIQSAGRNRNIACAPATGDILLCQDADDLPHPQRVEIVKSCFERYHISHLMHTYIMESHEFSPYVLEEISPEQYYFYDHIPQAPFHNGNIACLASVAQAIQWQDSLPCDQDVKFNREVYKKFHNNAVINCALIIYRWRLSAFKLYGHDY